MRGILLRAVLVVGAGPVAASKLDALRAAGATVHVVAPEIHPDIERQPVRVSRREFRESDLEGVWLVVAAAPPDVNCKVAEAAEQFVCIVNRSKLVSPRRSPSGGARCRPARGGSRSVGCRGGATA